jgi:hypothetical protein
MGKRSVQLVATALAGVLLGGCAGGSGGSPAPGDSVSTPPTPPPSSAGPSAPGPSPRSRFSAVPPPPTKPAAEQTLSGQVIEGVEAGCQLLHTAKGDFLLIVPANVDKSMVRAGARIVVRGRAEPGMVTTCQQGTPFLVSEVRPG